MQCNANIPNRLETLGVALLLAIAVPGCVAVDAVTAPDGIAVATKPATQSPVAATFTFANTVGAGSAISSDGLSGAYRDTVCGVTARVFFLSPNYLDGNLQLDNARAADRKCATFGAAAYPRKLTVQYPDNGLIQTRTGGLNVADLGTVLSSTPELRSMSLRIEGTGTRCASLGFGSAAGGSQVQVTRVSSTSWGVSSQAGGSAACVAASGVTTIIANFAVAFTVTLN